MVVHKIGTYNMSFASDLGIDPQAPTVSASEAAFLLSNDTGNPRAFWENALKIVKAFMREENFSAIGLQEMNMTIDARLKEETEALTTAEKTYKYELNKVDAPWGAVAAAIIWDAAKLGDKEDSTIYDLDYAPQEYTDQKTAVQKGRPIMFLLTKKGYLLINLHAPNHEELSRRTLADFRKALQEKTTTFMEGKGSIANGKVFVMGDFNDRYDSLKTISLDINGVTHNLKYNGNAPYSCCHNWDSSCSGERYTTFDPIGRPKNAERTIGTCKVPIYEEKHFEGKAGPYKKKVGDEFALAGPPGAGPRVLMGEEGNIENYRYTGDKVFGENPVEGVNIAIYPPGRVGASKESDHEAVAADFNDGQGGGARRHRGSRSAHRKGRATRRRAAHRRRRATRHKGSRRR